MKTPLLAYIAFISFVFPVISGIHKWNENVKQMKLFAYFCFSSALLTTIEFTLGKMGIRNHQMINFNYLVDLIMINLFFYSAASSSRLRKTIAFLNVLFTIYWILHNIVFAHSNEINETTAAISKILMIIGGVMILIERFNTSRVSLIHSSVFWIVTGVIIYCTGSIFLLSFSETIMKINLHYFLIMWYINWILAIVSNVFFAKSFYHQYI